MTDAEKLKRALLWAFASAKRKSPYKTGNLRHFGMRSSVTNAKEVDIYVDTAVAPYMKYTNEPWNSFGAPLQGKQNPNEGWWEKAAEAAARTLAQYVGGTLQ